jgi:chromosome segregation protein
MRLQKIKLSGFKSFVDTTTIDIAGNLVGIVGPNGCGKSNVIDAVRWVLGESSAKQLRGENMQDVIFSGSTQRKPVSRASVELTFDNSAKLLSGMFGNFDEVAVRRVLARSGESSYYINNQLVRRKDITELFLGTGLGSKGYAVIEQGMISKIIDAKPEELRFYLEEAAAVSKYREKRRETLAKLADTQENLLRITDINCELEKQIAVLRIQAADAEKYQAVKDDLNKQQVALHKHKLSTAVTLLDQLNTRGQDLTKQLTSVVELVETTDKELNSQYTLKQDRDGQLAQLVLQFNNTRTMVARLEERVQQTKSLQQRLANEKDKLVSERLELEKTLSVAEVQINQSKEQIQTNLTIFNKQQQIYQAELHNFKAIEVKYNEQVTLKEQSQHNLQQAQHKHDLLDNSYKHKNQQLANLLTRLNRLNQEKSENLLDLNQGYQKLELELAELEPALLELNNKLAMLKADKLLIVEQINNTMRELDKFNLEINTCNSKVSFYQEQLKQASNNTVNSKEIELESLDTLWQGLVVESGYELAVEVALREVLHALKVKDLSQITNIPDQKLVLWFGQGEQLTATNLSLASLDKFVTLGSKQFSRVSNILSHYIVADNLTEALTQLQQLDYGYTLVTLDGHLVNQDYIVLNAKSSSNPLQYKAIINQLTQQVNEFESQKLSQKQALAISQQQLAKVEQQLIELDNLYNSKSRLKHELQIKLAKEEQVVLQNKAYQEKVLNEYQLLNQEVGRVQNELSQLELQRDELKSTLDGLQQQLNLNQANYTQIDNNYKTGKIKLDELNTAVNQASLDNKLLNQQLTANELVINGKKQQLQLINQKITHIENEHNGIILDKESQELSGLQSQLLVFTNDISESNQKLAQLGQEISLVKAKHGQLVKNRDELYSKQNQLQLKQQEQQLLINSELESLKSLDQDVTNNFSDLIDDSITIKQYEKNIKSLKEQIEMLGLVNLKAISDLKDSTTKHNEVIARVSDLREAISTLENVIKKIDGETRTILNNTYNKVNLAFADYFTTLFGGGGASLELTDSDILNAGIQVFAKPPGKKNSSLQLLSGGEKALTAMSLIFAFFNLNPTSFCLLDEVDAPLDDANTSRFCNLVQQLSKNTQFVYISHNRLTMEMANQLVGVTMQEKGVSTVVSVNLVDAIKHAV